MAELRAFEHVLITRFNVRPDTQTPAPADAWMAGRFELFERYCLPSVRRQTRRDFSWVVLFDAATSARWHRHASDLARLGGFHCVTLDAPFSPTAVSAKLTELGLSDAPFLITTRLDNDDALGPGYVEMVQRAFRPVELEFLNAPLGYQLAAGRVYLRPHVAGSFVSLVERRRPAPYRTVYAVSHQLTGNYPVRQLTPTPIWLQVVHGTNLSNDIRGIPVAGRRAAAMFGLAGVSCTAPSMAERTAAVAAVIRRAVTAPSVRTRIARGTVGSARVFDDPVPRRRPERVDSHRTATRVVALLACHNRRELTLRALRGWFGQRDCGCELSAVLVDDGCTDGTAAAVRAEFPDVTVIRGSGSLYWAAGMAVAEAEAQRSDPDAMVWLNDDVDLDPDALRVLRATSERSRPAAVVGGALVDPATGRASYGGVRPSRWHPLRIRLVEPTGQPQRVPTVHGNVVYVPGAAHAAIGSLDGRYAHAYADLDFGLRSSAAGYPVLLTGSAIGRCSRTTSSRSGDPANASLRRRLAALNSPRGVPLRSQARFLRRHAGPWWPLLAIAPYAREVVRLRRRSAP